MKEPTITPPDRVERYESEGTGSPTRQYPWDKILLGQWQCWQDLPSGTLMSEAAEQATRLRNAAAAHARRNGLQVESRTQNGRRIVDLRFTEKAS